jgi:acyl carrier protein
MIPQAVVVLDALPVGPTGKLDRGALPHPTLGAPAGGSFQTEIERMISATWSDVLGVEVSDREDDFFTLGGQSLLALRTLSKLRRTLNVKLSLAELFEHRTVAALATRLDEMLANEDRSNVGAGT